MVQLLLHQQSLVKITVRTKKQYRKKRTAGKKLQFLKSGKKGSCIWRWLLAFKAKYRFVKAHLDALRTAKTNPANFVLHEITDSCERLFQGFGIGSNGLGHPFEKRLSSVPTALAIRLKKECHPWNDSGYRFRKIVICSIRSNDSNYPLEKEMSSLGTTQAIRSRKIVIGSNGSSYLSAALQFQITFTLVVCDESVKKSCKLYK